MESFHLLLHPHWNLEPFVPKTPPKIEDEDEHDSRVSAFRFPLSAFPPRFMGSFDLRISDAHWTHEPNPISRSSRGNEALIFFPTNGLG